MKKLYQVSLNNNKNNEVIAELELYSIPRKDEVLWICDWQHNKDKCSRYMVKEVCYWVSIKMPYQNICLYVEPIEQ